MLALHSLAQLMEDLKTSEMERQRLAGEIQRLAGTRPSKTSSTTREV
jgi:hypothetical protein